MIRVVPDFYPEFACIASRCGHSCCVGWEVDVDEDSLKEGIYTGLLYGLGDPYSRYYRLQFAFICPFPHQSGMSSFNVIVAFSL